MIEPQSRQVTKPIRIRPETRVRLQIKKHDAETYDQYINRLMDEADTRREQAS